jgi:hypothetical protein
MKNSKIKSPVEQFNSAQESMLSAIESSNIKKFKVDAWKFEKPQSFDAARKLEKFVNEAKNLERFFAGKSYNLKKFNWISYGSMTYIYFEIPENEIDDMKTLQNELKVFFCTKLPGDTGIHGWDSFSFGIDQAPCVTINLEEKLFCFRIPLKWDHGSIRIPSQDFFLFSERLKKNPTINELDERRDRYK